MVPLVTVPAASVTDVQYVTVPVGLLAVKVGVLYFTLKVAHLLQLHAPSILFAKTLITVLGSLPENQPVVLPVPFVIAAEAPVPPETIVTL